MSESARSRRLTDEAIFTVSIKKRYLLPIITLLIGPGGFATYKAISVQDTATEAQQKAITGRQEIQKVAQKTDIEADAAYEVWKKSISSRDYEMRILVNRVNELIEDQDRLRSLCLPSRRRKQPSQKIELPKKPELPPTPEAAAAKSGDL